MVVARSFLSALCLITLIAPAEEWNRFRGPNGSGLSADAGYPVTLQAKNRVWRTSVRPGKSSPVLTARHAFLTSFSRGKLFTECYDRQTGRLLWERSEDRRGDPMANILNHPAAITPVTDGENVYALFKDFGLISYDAAGRVRWKAPLGPFSNTMGLGASPILAGNSVIVLADQVDGLSYIAAFDRGNGELRWKKARDEGEGWGTPLLLDRPGAAPLILTASRGQVGVYEPRGGSRIVSWPGIATTIVGSPVRDRDTVFVFGYGSEAPGPFEPRLSRYDTNRDGQLSPDEYGNDAFIHGIGKYVGNRDSIVTKEEWDAKQKEVIGPNRLTAFRLEGDPPRVRELWRYDKNFTGVIPSPLIYEDVLYVIRNGGILTAFDARTGNPLKAGRIEGALSGYSASPVAADGKLFLTSEECKIAVLKPGADWQVTAVSDLGESCYATPALSNGQVYVRTSEALYRFDGGGAAK